MERKMARMRSKTGISATCSFCTKNRPSWVTIGGGERRVFVSESPLEPPPFDDVPGTVPEDRPTDARATA